MDKITKEQQLFYDRHKNHLMNKFLKNFQKKIDLDLVCDLFEEIGYGRANFREFKEIGEILTEDIYIEALTKIVKPVKK